MPSFPFCARLLPLLSLTAFVSISRLGAAEPASIAPSPKESFTAAEVREDLATLAEFFRTRWAYEEEKTRQTGRTLAEHLADSLGQVAPLMSSAEARSLLAGFVASLQDGHAQLQFEAEAADSVRGLPVRFIDTPEGVAVAETAGPDNPLLVGDLVVTLNQEAIETTLARLIRRASTSTAAARRAFAISRLPPVASSHHRITVLRDGAALEFTLPSVPRHSLPWANLTPAPDAWPETRLLAPDIGYVRIKTWLPQTPEHSFEKLGAAGYASHWNKQTDTALAPLRDLPDLVIDVRGNLGGSDPICMWFVSHFAPAPPAYYLRFRAPPEKSGTPEAPDGYLNPRHVPAVYPAHPGPPSQARLWVLVDELCYSATDTFLHALKTNLGPRVTLIGRPSNGGIGGPALVGALPHTGGRLRLSTCKVFALDGTLLEGNPARIDHPVRWTRADLLDGRDPDLEKALRLIAAENGVLHVTPANPSS